MKKLMMLAAAMTIVGGAYAASNACQDIDNPDTPTCLEVGVWDFTASGKWANESPKGAYKAVQSFSLKGALVSASSPSYTEEYSWVTNFPGTPTQAVVYVTNSIPDYANCCIEGFDVYIYDKKSDTVVKFPAMDWDDGVGYVNPIKKMTVFGKNLETVLKPGKSTTIESDILWNFGDGLVVEDTETEMNLQFVGFGKAKRWMSKATPDTDPCGDNSTEGCAESIDWPSWSGWFTGVWGDDSVEFEDMLCDGPCWGIAGGTWSAKFNKKLAAASDIDQAIENKFKADLVISSNE